MANAKYEVLEIDFKFFPTETVVTVICGPASDGTLGIQGAHRKSFPPDRSAVDLLQIEIAGGKYLLW